MQRRLERDLFAAAAMVKERAGAILEVCCDSRESVRAAVAGGASRVEVCARSSLGVGGLTPSPTLVKLCLGECFGSPCEVVALVRVRCGDFACVPSASPKSASTWRDARVEGHAMAGRRYSREELDEMVEEIRSLRSVGCRSFAIGRAPGSTSGRRTCVFRRSRDRTCSFEAAPRGRRRA